MQNTIRYTLFLFIVSGLLFSGCKSEVEDADMDLPSAEEIEDQTGIDTLEIEESVDEDGRPAPQVEDSEDSDSEEDAGVYEDGSYTSSGSYASPAGPESIGVTLTVEEGAVTAVKITNNATDQASKMFQEQFAAGISAKVIGKSLDEIGGYSSVNGSSLTPNGFDAALEAIKAEASS